jgi:4-amino-4-deoxy-L-arabinose transferase-like glycosyltransferase
MLSLVNPMRPRVSVEAALPTCPPRQRASWRLASLVFLASLLLRLAALDQAAFTYDEADAMLRARTVAGGELALAGAMTSWGVQDPPLQVYLLALVARSPDPVVASLALMATLNSLAVLVTYLLAERYYGRRVALIAGLLFAVNPWAVYFGRRAWIQLQPILTTLSLWAALAVVVGGRRVAALPFWVSLAANVQMRLLSLAYAPAALATILLDWRAWLTRWSLLGVVTGAALSVPYAVYIMTQWPVISRALGEGNRTVATEARHGALEFAWWTLSGLNLLATDGQTAWLERLGLAMQANGLASLALLALGLAAASSQIAKGVHRRSAAILLVWTIAPLALVAVQSSSLYLHYYVFLMPQLFLVAALGADWLIGRARTMRLIGVALVALVVVVQLVDWLSLQQVLSLYQQERQSSTSAAERRLLAELTRLSGQRIGTGESYGVETPVGFWVAARDQTRALLAEQPRELLIATDGSDPLANAKPAILQAMLGPTVNPRYLDATALTLPVDRPALLLWTGDVDLPLHPDRLGQQRALIPLPSQSRTARDGIRLFDLPARSAAEYRFVFDASRAADQPPPGWIVQLRVEPRVRAGESLDVVMLVAGPELAAIPKVWLDGLEPARSDSQAKPLRARPGDVVLSTHQVEVPGRATPGERRLLAGFETASGPARATLATIAVRR